MSPSTPNRLFSNKVSGLEVDHRHIDRTVKARSRRPDTLPAFKYFPDRAPQDEAPDPFECQYEQQPEDSRVERIECRVPLREEQDEIGENEYVDDPRDMPIWCALSLPYRGSYTFFMSRK